MAATDDSFHLYSYFASSCCQRVIIAAHLKSIPLTFTFLDLATDAHLAAPYRDSLNPSRTVPTLVVTHGHDHKTTIIRQSLAILEYLEERLPSPSPLLPGSPEQRALVRDLVGIIVVDVAPPTNSRITQRVRDIRGERDDQREFARACFTDGLRAYEALLAGTAGTAGTAAAGAFSVGEAVTMADVCLVPTVDQALMYEMDISFVPRVKRLYESLKALPAFQAADWRRQPDTPEKYRV
ncbi:Maleylacetoacetate isomerase [Cordyceps fumosorosea ARSEF 2679]|uniref:Maleylacetoacetate isomerase n=1 Tax=Cordyceps fumosorosea (strain ARSEF 2679) TaxID=1081104 RepID=A0A167SXI4_CORFA|nr:Maleylacetoacetate isomerase [Cordyceps fumosorosea ARSEF 2679]OAA60032.1 Maleylacetoacetate isomerase [Cordyceps fumosorosea ARSEF 2679]